MHLYPKIKYVLFLAKRQMTQDLKWEVLKLDNDYEIALDQNELPLIRKRSNKKILSQSLAANHKYQRVRLNRVDYYVHRIASIQYLNNDDPEHKTYINHKNHNTKDNRLSNFEWTTPKTNSQDTYKYEYLTIEEFSLLSTIPIGSYNSHEFDDLYYDREAEQFYELLGNGKYKIKPWRLYKNRQSCGFTDSEGKRCVISKIKFDRNLMEAGFT
jgi:hypothetical protein